MDLVIWNPIPPVLEALQTVIDGNPTLKAFVSYTKQLLRNPVYLTMFICYATCILTPILFYLSIGFSTVAGIILVMISVSGFTLGSITIVIIVSLSILYGIFLLFASQFSFVAYLIQRLGIW